MGMLSVRVSAVDLAAMKLDNMCVTKIFLLRIGWKMDQSDHLDSVSVLKAWMTQQHRLMVSSLITKWQASGILVRLTKRMHMAKREHALVPLSQSLNVMEMESISKLIS